MTLTPRLERMANKGYVGAPVIIKVKYDYLPILQEDLVDLEVKIRGIRRFNMASTFLPQKVLDFVEGLDYVERIYLDREMRIPEVPQGFSVADFVRLKRIIELPRIRSLLAAPRAEEIGKEWVGTAESRAFVGADVAEAEGITGRGVKVAVVDTDASHRLLAHRQVNYRAERRLVRSLFKTDTNGHGGHVLTTILGSPVSLPNGMELKGVAPGARGLVVKALLTPIGTGSTSDCIKGVEIALGWGADIINLSLGSAPEEPENDPFCDAISQVPQEQTIFCVASGNEGAEEVGSPACCKDAIAIGAFDIRQNKVADFSNAGEELDFIMPGVNVYTGITQETLLDVITKGGPAFSSLSGTSMATPHASGMCALMMEHLQREFGIRLTADLLRDIGEKVGEPHTTKRGYGLITWDLIKRYATEYLSQGGRSK